MLDLINEVLDISRIEAGQLSISNEAVPWREVLQECVSLIAPLAVNRSIRIEDQCRANGKRHVLADRQRLKQIFLNLLSNAVKYNRKGGIVTLSCEEPSAGRLRLKVSDTGIGIAQQDLPRLFGSFERLHAEGSGTPGTGLGLALSKSLAELMGGSMGVESVAGQGSTFWVELAVADDPSANAASSEKMPPVTATVADDHHKVLYIEDNFSNVKLVERLMARRPGVKLISATQGELGLELARQHRPDLILLDLHLPDIPGRELLSRLRAEEATRECPVVVISADATSAEIGRFRAAGARDYLTKPIDVRQFLSVLDAALAAGKTQNESRNGA